MVAEETKETSWLLAPNARIIWGSGGMLPREKNWKLDSQKRHVLQFLDRKQLIHKSILLSFSQSIVIHDSRAEVQTPKVQTWFPSF